MISSPTRATSRLWRRSTGVARAHLQHSNTQYRPSQLRTDGRVEVMQAGIGAMPCSGHGAKSRSGGCAGIGRRVTPHSLKERFSSAGSAATCRSRWHRAARAGPASRAVSRAEGTVAQRAPSATDATGNESPLPTRGCSAFEHVLDGTRVVSSNESSTRTTTSRRHVNELTVIL